MPFLKFLKHRLPDTAFAESSGQPVGAQKENHVDNRLEQADRRGQGKLRTLNTGFIDVCGDDFRPVHDQIILKCEGTVKAGTDDIA